MDEKQPVVLEKIRFIFCEKSLLLVLFNDLDLYSFPCKQDKPRNFVTERHFKSRNLPITSQFCYFPISNLK